MIETPKETARGQLFSGALFAFAQKLENRATNASALDAHRNAHAAADAKRGEALLGVALLHLIDQRGEDARARGADRVADRDRAAVDVDLVGVPAELLADRKRLRGEGFVGFDQVEIGDRPAGLLQRAPCEAGTGPMPIIEGIDAARGPARDRAPATVEPRFVGFLARTSGRGRRRRR